MSKRSNLLVLVLALLLPAVALFAHHGPDDVVIDDCVAKRAAVPFPHGKHSASIACATCHHTQPKLTAESDEKAAPCASCHVKPEKAETPKCSEMSLTKNPFHINCVDCHKTENAKSGKKLPTTCDACHAKA